MNDLPILLKAAGGKRKLLSEILPLIPQVFRGSYIEPFVGGGAVFFALEARGTFERFETKDPVLNDSNPEMMAAYRAVQNSVDDLISELKTYRYEESFYYAMRAKDPSQMPLVPRAARMIYLNKTCFNGLYRVNGLGKFNVPMGKYTNPTICDEELLRRASLALSGARLLCEDFEAVMDEAVEGDVVYADPPYVPLDKGSFTKFGKDDFKHEDQVRLRDAARRCKERGVHVVLSNSGSPVVEDLYADGFTIRTAHQERAINSRGGLRGLVKEVLIT